MGYPRNMSNFLRVLYSYIEAYFRYAFLYTNKDQSRPRQGFVESDHQAVKGIRGPNWVSS